VIVRSAGCNPIQAITIIPVCHECGVLAINIGVVFHFHISATTPGFISQAPEPYIPRSLSSACFTQVCHGAASIGMRCVFNPVCQFLRCAATHIAAEIRFCSEQFTHVQEFVCAKTV